LEAKVVFGIEPIALSKSAMGHVGVALGFCTHTTPFKAINGLGSSRMPDRSHTGAIEIAYGCISRPRLFEAITIGSGGSLCTVREWRGRRPLEKKTRWHGFAGGRNGDPIRTAWS